MPDSLVMDAKPPSKAHKQNANFYWEPVTFLVEDQLFKVTRHMLAKSSKTLLTMVSPRGMLPRWLDLMTSIRGHTREQKAVPRLSPDEWLSVLKLATMWGMVDIRRMAINEITQLKLMTDALTKRQAVFMQSTSELTLPTCLKVWQAQVSILNACVLREHGPDKPEHQILNDMFASELDKVYQRGIAFGDDARHSKPGFSASQNYRTTQHLLALPAPLH
ncbi:hypothetical protein DFS33DRAFT_1376863 [Desarmillaria ectypa]|nr:hypothetical protein DFS33DRAFT_1376863 [Desarmillaria ectypa]